MLAGNWRPSLGTRLRLGLFFTLVALQRMLPIAAARRTARPGREPCCPLAERERTLEAEPVRRDPERHAAPGLDPHDHLKRLIVTSLNLDGLTPERIADDEPLFGAGLGLDSVDALELVVALEKEYGISIASHEVDRSVFAIRGQPGRRSSSAGLGESKREPADGQ